MTARSPIETPESLRIVRVEISRFTLGGGEYAFAVDYVTADGSRAWMWSGSDYRQAIEAAGDCAGPQRLPILDLVQEEHRSAPIQDRRAIVETVRMIWDDAVADELADDLGVEPESTTLH